VYAYGFNRLGDLLSCIGAKDSMVLVMLTLPWVENFNIIKWV